MTGKTISGSGNPQEGAGSMKSGTMDITPTKRVIWSKAVVCDSKNAITEIQDNIIDYVAERKKKGKLRKSVIESSFDLGPNRVVIRWNMGIPANKRRAFLVPGLHQSDDTESIGTWSMGGKIAIHALGDDIKIRTCTPEDEKVVSFHFPKGWLVDANGDYNEENQTDWTVIRDYEDKGEEDEFTEIVIMNPSSKVKKQFNKDSDEYRERLSALCDYVAETYGLTFNKWMGDAKFSMRLNGKQIASKTYTSPENIKENLSRVPGFEPTEHFYKYKDLNIRVIVGCTWKMDVDDGGMFMYGNHSRLFARRERNSEYLSEIDVTHPQRKHWQMHIFFTGNTELIPWNSPLKEGVNYGHETMMQLKTTLNKLPTPYIEMVLKSHAPERRMFSENYLRMNQADKKKYIEKLFGKVSVDDDYARYMKMSDIEKGKFLESIWRLLPRIAKKGREFDEKTIKQHDHGKFPESAKERIRCSEPKWSLTFARKWLNERGINQRSTRTLLGKIDAIWAFNEFIDPEEKRQQIELPETEVEVDQTAADTDEREVISGRIRISDRKQLAAAAGSDKSTDIVLFLVEGIFPEVKRLLSLPKLPEEIRGKSGMIEKLKALVKHLGGTEEATKGGSRTS